MGPKLSDEERKARDREGAKRFYWAHLDSSRARSRNYQQAHPEKRRAQVKLFYIRHPDLKKKRSRRWQISNPEAVRAATQRHRTLKRGLPNTLTVREWQAICIAYKGRCAYCGRKAKLTQDHVQPLSNGGGTTAFNIVPACQSCNSAKGNRPPPKPVKLAFGI